MEIGGHFLSEEFKAWTKALVTELNIIIIVNIDLIDAGMLSRKKSGNESNERTRADKTDDDNVNIKTDACLILLDLFINPPKISPHR